MIPLVLASHNEKKLAELQSVLSDLPVKTVSLRSLPDAPRVDEDGLTFEENAVKKALEVARWCGNLTLADDSGLCVDALGGAPGVHSARYAGDSQDDVKNCEKLLQAMTHVPERDRGASFVCVVALASAEQGLLGTARGECLGSIAFDRKGSHGFGYDPVFTDPVSGKRFAELSPEIKNRISHRAQALRKAKEILKEHLRILQRKSCKTTDTWYPPS